MVFQGRVQRRVQSRVAALRAAHRLRDDLFHNPIPIEVLGRQLHQLTGLAAAGRIFPQDAGKALRTEHRVNGVFQHEDVVCHAQCQCTAAGALARNDGDDGHSQAAHLHQVAGDGLALTPFLGFLAGVSTRRVNKGNDGAAKFFGLLHQAQSLAVPLGARHSKIAGHVFFQCGTLAVTDDGHGHPVEFGDAAQNSPVFPALAVTALLKEIGKQSVDGLVDVGTGRMPGQKDPVLGGQRATAAEDLILLHSQLRQLRGMGRDGAHIALFVGCIAAQGCDLGIQRSKLLQKVFNHSVFLPLRGAAAAGSA